MKAVFSTFFGQPSSARSGDNGARPGRARSGQAGSFSPSPQSGHHKSTSSRRSTASARRVRAVFLESHKKILSEPRPLTAFQNITTGAPLVGDGFLNLLVLRIQYNPVYCEHTHNFV